MLTAPGQTAGWSPFAITLQHCSGSATLVRAHFEPGTFVDMATGRLDLDANSSAANVQIALRELGSTHNILIGAPAGAQGSTPTRSEEHTSELQSLMRISYAVFCLNKKLKHTTPN